MSFRWQTSVETSTQAFADRQALRETHVVPEMAQPAYHEGAPGVGEPGREVSRDSIRINADGTRPLDIGFPSP